MPLAAESRVFRTDFKPCGLRERSRGRKQDVGPSESLFSIVTTLLYRVFGELEAVIFKGD